VIASSGVAAGVGIAVAVTEAVGAGVGVAGRTYLAGVHPSNAAAATAAKRASTKRVRRDRDGSATIS
jgi:hypothetical protein